MTINTMTAPDVSSLESKLHDAWLLFNKAVHEDSRRNDKTTLETALRLFIEVEEASTGNRNGLKGDACQGRIACNRKLERYIEASRLIDLSLKQHVTSDDDSGVPTEHPGILSEAGWLHLEKKELVQAVQRFAQAKNADGVAAGIEMLRRSSRYLEAKCSLQKLEHSFSESLPFQLERAWLTFNLQDYGTALHLFNNIRDQWKDCDGAAQGIIACYRQMGDFKSAQEKYDLLNQESPGKPGIMSEQGWLYYDQNELAKADRSFQDAIRHCPESVPLKLCRVDVLTRAGETRVPREILDQLTRDTGGDATILNYLGQFFLRRNDLLSAEAEYLKIIAEWDDDPNGPGGLGMVYFHRGGYVEALKYFKRARDLDPAEPAWNTSMAWAFVRQDNLSEAEKLCRQALESDPNYPDTLGCLGVIAYKRDDIFAAEDYFLSSIRSSKKEGHHVDLGALYLQMGRLEEAENQLKVAVEMNPFDSYGRIVLGSCFLEQDKPAEAAAHFRRAVQSDPRNIDSSRFLAIALMRLGKFSESENVLRKTLKATPTPRCWSLHLTLSQLFTRMGDDASDANLYEEALREINAAICIESRDPEVRFQAGLLYLKTKDYRSARKQFRECGAEHNDAMRFSRLIQRLLKEEAGRSRLVLYGGFILGATSLGFAVSLWLLYFLYLNETPRVSDNLLLVLTPLLLGLTAVSIVLPWMTRLKMTGLEADIGPAQEMVATGPKGQMAIPSALPTIKTGPR